MLQITREEKRNQKIDLERHFYHKTDHDKELDKGQEKKIRKRNNFDQNKSNIFQELSNQNQFKQKEGVTNHFRKFGKKRKNVSHW